MWIPLRFASQCCSCLFRTTVSELPEVPASSLAASLFTVMARWTDRPSRGKSQVWARFNFPPDRTCRRKPAMYLCSDGDANTRAGLGIGVVLLVLFALHKLTG